MSKFIKLDAIVIGAERDVPPKEHGHIHRQHIDEAWVKATYGEKYEPMKISDIVLHAEDEVACEKVFLNIDNIVEICSQIETHTWKSDDKAHPKAPHYGAPNYAHESEYERGVIRTTDGLTLYVIDETASEIIKRIETIIEGADAPKKA